MLKFPLRLTSDNLADNISSRQSYLTVSEWLWSTPAPENFIVILPFRPGWYSVQDLQQGRHIITNSVSPSHLIVLTALLLLLLLLLLDPLVHHQLVELLPRHLVDGNPLHLQIVHIVEDNLGRLPWQKDQLFPRRRLNLITWNLAKTCPQIISLKFPKDETLDIFELEMIVSQCVESQVETHLVETSSPARLYHSAVDLKILLSSHGQGEARSHEDHHQLHRQDTLMRCWARHYSKTLISLIIQNVSYHIVWAD